jgi:hypothetical protein
MHHLVDSLRRAFGSRYVRMLEDEALKLRGCAWKIARC